jgi:anaerobic magnesium-protoporphyrin IX monomethyl ester cyclase
MKIILLNPSYGKNFVRSARWAARSRGRVQRHQDYLAIATAVLENEGHNVKLLDAASLNIDFDGVKEIASGFKPDLAVVHTTTPSIYNDVKHVELLKDLGSTTALIGQHASALPEATMQMSDKIDFIARGEYDYTLRDVANEKDPVNIAGITYRNGNEILTNEDRPLIKNLDELPFPAWHQIDGARLF